MESCKRFTDFDLNLVKHRIVFVWKSYFIRNDSKVFFLCIFGTVVAHSCIHKKFIRYLLTQVKWGPFGSVLKEGSTWSHVVCWGAKSNYSTVGSQHRHERVDPECPHNRSTGSFHKAAGLWLIDLNPEVKHIPYGINARVDTHAHQNMMHAKHVEFSWKNI